MIFITINALHASGDSSAHRQKLKTLYTALGVCWAWQTPDAVYTVSSSWWFAEEPPETRTAFIVINTIV